MPNLLGGRRRPIEERRAVHRKLSFAIFFFGAFVIGAPVFAQAAWPPIVTKYVAGVRKTVKTMDAKGYLAAVKDPKGAHPVEK
jgi:hypothetical protein